MFDTWIETPCGLVPEITFAGLVEVLQTWSRYWFEVVDLPNGVDGDE